MAYILYVSPWTYITDNFMPYYTHRTKPVVVVRITIVVVEVEWTCVAIIIVAPTFEERVRRVHKVRVRFSFIPIKLIAPFTLAYGLPKISSVLITAKYCLALMNLCSSHFRFHITLLHTPDETRCSCKKDHCRCWSRMNPRGHYHSSPHVRRKG